MHSWRPDRSQLLLILAVVVTAWWVVLEALGDHPDYGLLGIAAPLWGSWATSDREVQRRRLRQERRENGNPSRTGEDEGDGT